MPCITDATLQRTMHSDALHIGWMYTNSIQGDRVRGDSDAAHANSKPYRSAMAPGGALRRVVVRHSLVARLTHWMSALAMSLLLVTGLQIFKAFPALYLGDTGYETSGAVFEIGADTLADGTAAGWLRIGSHRWITTGFLGTSRYAGETQLQGFPGWLTIPGWRDLAAGRRWHLFLARL